MRIRHLVLFLSAYLIACGGNGRVNPAPLPAPPFGPADDDVLPSGIVLSARMDQAVSTNISSVGQAVSATVATAIIAQTGETVVPVGARIHGTITGLNDSDHPFDRALIRLNFDQLEFNGRRYPLSAALEFAQVRVGDRVIAAKKGALAGAGVGAIASAILTGVELDEVLKYAALGAGAGAIIGVLTPGDDDAVVPAGSLLELRTTRSIDLR